MVGIFWGILPESFPYPALSGLTVDTWLRQFMRLWYFTHVLRECAFGLWIFCEILPEMFAYSALFDLTVDTHFFKVVFMPVVMLDRRLVRPKPVVVRCSSWRLFSCPLCRETVVDMPVVVKGRG